ncbi:LysR family transcriptional regulator [Vogesella oryzae]|uniref:LysR family transcriptional regulator n=1 Tax=Vogesella oryzae TaxID=1735285 RepID=UPI001C2EFC2B|nr:LysR family transcriptional regulator [Vogesella oryzae]
MTLKLSLRELEVFAAIADAESVTRAADALALSQSAASQALAQLESALGATLFDRVGRRLQLNENGRALLPRARALLDDAAALQDLFGNAALSLRLGASTTIANYLLPQRLAALRRDWPQCKVLLQVANTRDIVAAVAALRVDFGLIEGPCHHPELLATPWQQDELVLIAAAQHPLAQGTLTREKLAAAPWLLREAGSGTREEVERVLLPELGSLRLEMELGDSEAIKRAVAAGLGISCLSRRVVAELLADGSLVELAAGLPPLARTLWCVRHRDKPASRSMQAFLQLDAAAG